MVSFQEKVQQQFDNKLPFAIYRKPNEREIHGVFQLNDNLNFIKDFSEKGLVFCSFDGNQNIIIPENQSERFVFQNDMVDFITENSIISNNKSNKQSSFENLVEKGILAIKNNSFKKVVLSRNETIDLKSFDLISVFTKLVCQYQSAFRYCFYHPKVGLWLGATPEQLLKVENNIFKTVSLAGTQKFNGTTDATWGEKELQEQKYVSDFILNSLKKASSDIKISETFTVRAANLLHLKSEISGHLNEDFNLNKIIKILHPTPAVCGLPKEGAKQFIIENEDYDREFYTGFLGELNINNKTDLFVNLRCMNIATSRKKANVYVGCGITKDSISDKEYFETENKSMTMKNLLDI